MGSKTCAPTCWCSQQIQRRLIFTWLSSFIRWKVIRRSHKCIVVKLQAHRWFFNHSTGRDLRLVWVLDIWAVNNCSAVLCHCYRRKTIFAHPLLILCLSGSRICVLQDSVNLTATSTGCLSSLLRQKWAWRWWTPDTHRLLSLGLEISPTSDGRMTRKWNISCANIH